MQAELFTYSPRYPLSSPFTVVSQRQPLLPRFGLPPCDVKGWYASRLTWEVHVAELRARYTKDRKEREWAPALVKTYSGASALFDVEINSDDETQR